MSVLVCLAEHPGEVVSKEQLLQRVWPDTFVGEGVLTRSIFELRRVFEDEAKEPRVIQTIAKRGYRLVASVMPRSSEVEVVPSVACSPLPGDQCPVDRIAVFPLTNPEGSPDAKHLLSGIPGSIIRGLSPLPGLTVVAGGFVPGGRNSEGNAQAFGVGSALGQHSWEDCCSAAPRCASRSIWSILRLGKNCGPTNTTATSESFS
jgi:hypothetical protein